MADEGGSGKEGCGSRVEPPDEDGSLLQACQEEIAAGSDGKDLATVGDLKALMGIGAEVPGPHLIGEAQEKPVKVVAITAEEASHGAAHREHLSALPCGAIPSAHRGIQPCRVELCGAVRKGDPCGGAVRMAREVSNKRSVFGG